MRTTFRLSLAAVLLIAAAGIARAQDASAAPPPAAPDSVVAPVAELPAIPFAGSAPAVEPALTIDQSAIAVEPVAEPSAEPVQPPAAEKSQVTTTTRRVTKKTVKAPAENPGVEVSGPAKPAAAAASVSAVDTSANPPPPNAAANTAPAKSVQPLQAPAYSGAYETRTQTTPPPRKMGVGSWFLAGFAVAGLITAITLFRRRKSRRETSIPDFTGAQDLKPALAERH